MDGSPTAWYPVGRREIGRKLTMRAEARQDVVILCRGPGSGAQEAQERVLHNSESMTLLVLSSKMSKIVLSVVVSNYSAVHTAQCSTVTATVWYRLVQQSTAQ